MCLLCQPFKNIFQKQNKNNDVYLVMKYIYEEQRLTGDSVSLAGYPL